MSLPLPIRLAIQGNVPLPTYIKCPVCDHPTRDHVFTWLISGKHQPHWCGCYCRLQGKQKTCHCMYYTDTSNTL